MKALQRLGHVFPKGSVVSGGTIAIVMALNAISGILTARLLGPSGKGVLALAFVWAALVVQFADMGVSQALTYFASRWPEQRSDLWGKSIALTVGQSIIVLPMAALGAAVLVEASPALSAIFVALASVPPTLLLGYQLSLLRGQGRFKLFNAIRLAQAIAWTAAVLTFFGLSNPSPIGLLVCFLLTIVGASVAAAVALRRSDLKPVVNSEGLSPVLKYGLLVWIAGLGYQTNFRIDQFVLGATVSAADLGQYAAAVGLASLLTVISMGLAVVILPNIARARPEDQTKLGLHYWLLGVTLMVIGAAVLWILAPILVPRLLGASFAPSVRLLRILVVGQIALGSTQIIHEIARGQHRLRLPAIVESVGAVFTVGLLLFAIPQWGTVGAAWVSVAVYWPVTVALWYWVLHRPDPQSAVATDADHQLPTADDAIPSP